MEDYIQDYYYSLLIKSPFHYVKSLGEQDGLWLNIKSYRNKLLENPMFLDFIELYLTDSCYLLLKDENLLKAIGFGNEISYIHSEILAIGFVTNGNNCYSALKIYQVGMVIYL